MAQAASNVVDLWTKFYADGGNIGSMIPALEELTAPDVKYQVVGQPGQFALATTLEGKDAMMKYVATVLAPAFLGILNHTKPVVHESMALIGDPAQNRYALEVKETGTTLDGMLASPACLTMSIRGCV